MTILTRSEIIRRIKTKEIGINPYNPENIGPGSIDLTLDNKFRVYKKDAGPYEVTEESKISTVSEIIEAEKFVLRPGEACIGITKEKVTLPPNLCGWLEGRSRFARVGLMIHTTAGFVQPGVNNKQALEISNISPFPLVLHAGTRICQLIVEDTYGEATYKGRFSKQVNP